MEKIRITDFGVKKDSEEVQTSAIQACINKCRDLGGGEVVIPNGTYYTGSLELFSNITLRLEAGAVLYGSKNLEDYTTFGHSTTIRYLFDQEHIEKWHLPPYYFHAMISACKAENVAIIAEPGAVIDGQDVYDEKGEEKFRGPFGLVFSEVKNLHLEGYEIRNSSNWSHAIDSCENVTLHNIRLVAGHDGFNLHHSNHIRVDQCVFETGDDCLAGYDVYDLEVRDCYLNTACNAMRIGGKDLSFINCMFDGPGHYVHRSEGTTYTHAMFKYYAVRPDEIRNDGEGIRFYNCKINGADRVIYYDFDRYELMQDERPMRELVFENTMISGMAHTSYYKGGTNSAKLVLKNVIVDHEAEEVFLEIDDAINLVLENATFVRPTVIRLGNGSELKLEGTVDLQL